MTIKAFLKKSRSRALLEASKFDDIDKGVYIIRSENEELKPINRCVSSDELRIVYIGSGKVKSRYDNFRRILRNVNDKEARDLKGHAGAITYMLRFPTIKDIVPKDSLRFYFIKWTDCKGLESDLQLEYELKYGEFPPLNLSRVKHSSKT